MLLKSLEIQGFKTFPDKTKLTFDKGITSIVGPNGSGKSNISDAIRWVLGEQSPKSLRCSKMEDVVFNGTDGRKKQGYAEVTLTIENKDRMLAFGADEVAITRRYYRSGDSEYMINKASVRLKDIHELFMDTGLGRDGYSMIGQGKIDSIVSSKGEDRREIFEEAAGISRYRYRKIEAERKLKGTEENLIRLRDILTELEDRVGPLATQAKKAEAFLEYSKEKKDLEIALWVNTLSKSAGVIREHEEKLSIAKSQHENAEIELEEIAKQTEELFLHNSKHASIIDEIRREISSYDEETAQKQGNISVAQTNIAHNNENIKRIKDEMENIEFSAQNTEKEITQKKQNILQHKNEIDNLQAKYRNCENSLNEINLNASKNSDMLQEVSLKLTKLSAKAADIKVSAMTSLAASNEAQNRKQILEENKRQKAENLLAFSSRLDDYNQMLKETTTKHEMITNALRGCELKIAGRQKKRDQLKNQSDKLQLDLQERQRRIKILEDLERNLEGFYQSVKIVLKESQRGTLNGIHGPVSRVIQVPSEYTVAIETSLGNAMQHIVTGNEEDAKRAIQFLKQRDGGRATFLPLTSVKGYELKENGLENCDGFVGLASKLCSCEPKYNGVLQSLLGRVVVAENLNCAVVIAKKFGYKFRIVTLDGQVVNAGGSLTGGSLNRKSGLLSRAGEIEKNKQIAIKIEEDLNNVKAEFRKVQEEFSAAEADVLGLRADLANTAEEKIRLEAAIGSQENEFNNLKITIQELEKEISENKFKSENQSEVHKTAQVELEKLNAEMEEAEKLSDDITGGRKELTHLREEHSKELQELRLKIVSAEKDIETIEMEINLAISSENTKDQRKLSLQNEIEVYKDKNKEIETQINLLNEYIENLKSKALKARDKIEQMNAEREQTEKKTARLRQLEREKTSERENVGREVSRLEERKINLQKQYDDITSKLWEEYELTPREAENIVKPINNPSVAQKRLNELKGKIRGLGSVNVSAIEEYKEVSERYEFMNKQVNDVEKSKTEILRLIGDLTKQMREVFVTRFHEINEHFSRIFVELFGGGKAYLELANPEDILTSGIDIIVHPPGKIVVHLEALSGGEKALVAIALYFAIMKVSPAPFCVMDEIEAALDEVNVDRFAAYLRVMNDNTQFILITHRRGTMEEADVLYGVTMQDEGVSKLLSLRASEVASKLNMK